MHTIYIIRDIKKMSANEIRGFIFEKNRLERKDLSLLVNKLIEKSLINVVLNNCMNNHF